MEKNMKKKKEKQMLLALLSLRKLQEFQELCARNQGQRPIYVFSVISQV